MQLGYSNNVTKFTVCLLLVLLAGCWTMASRQASKTSLDFLEDGKTTKEMVVSKLGPPTGTFEGDRIISYRLEKTKEGYFVAELRARASTQGIPAGLSGSEGQYSLVLVFDENHVLQKHSLVRVK